MGQKEVNELSEGLMRKVFFKGDFRFKLGLEKIGWFSTDVKKEEKILLAKSLTEENVGGISRRAGIQMH